MKIYGNPQLFQARLDELMQSNNVNKSTLAAMVGITAASMSRYTNGHRLPDLQCALAISQCLGVSLEWLLGVTNDPTGKLPNEAAAFIDLYTKATPSDKVIINTILRKYQDKE